MNKRHTQSSVPSVARQGFTLVEMLVVITIISILLAGGAAVMRSGTEASSVRAAGDTLQSLVDQARSAAIGRGTEARLLIANNSTDDERYLRMALVVVAEAIPDTDNDPTTVEWVWKPLGGPRELPTGVFYTKDLGSTLSSDGVLSDWDSLRYSNVTGSTQFGRALETDYGDAGDWISLVFDSNGRVINPGLTENPLLAVNLGYIDGTDVEIADRFDRYVEGFVVIRSTGRPVRLESTYEQGGF